jgi:putative SOS response-associated peptidase YedK
MCGRFSLQATAEQVELFFGLNDLDPRLLVPRYNISPTQPIVIVRAGRPGSEVAGMVAREAVPMRWGLWPSWVKDPNDFPLLINARADGVASKSSFRNAFKRRRCLIPASGFYEWKAMGRGPKQPFWIAPDPGAGKNLIAFAGLWETWCGADGSEVDTATIITTDASGALAPIHHRMPVIIDRDQFDLWLSEETDAAALMSLLKPAAEDLLVAVAVSTRVNAARNDDPDLISPVQIPSGPDGDVAEPQPDDDEDQPSLF